MEYCCRRFWHSILQWRQLSIPLKCHPLCPVAQRYCRYTYSWRTCWRHRSNNHRYRLYRRYRSQYWWQCDYQLCSSQFNLNNWYYVSTCSWTSECCSYRTWRWNCYRHQPLHLPSCSYRYRYLTYSWPTCRWQRRNNYRYRLC